MSGRADGGAAGTRGVLSALVAGHVCVDLIPELRAPPDLSPGKLVDVGPLQLRPGGCVANTGSDLIALGAPARLVADIGDDDLGQILRRLLTARGVAGDGLCIVLGQTTAYSVVIEAPDRDRVFWHHAGANAHFDGRDLDLSPGDVLHLGYPSILPALTADGAAQLHALLVRAHAAGLTTSLDLAVVDPEGDAGHLDWTAILEAVLPLTDVFTPSIADLASALGRRYGTDPDALSGEADRLLGLGAGVVMLTAGPDGLVLRTAPAERLQQRGRVLAALPEGWGGRELWIPPLSSPRTTTTGAGDAATAGLLYGLLAGLSPEDALMTAAGAAALTLAGRRPLPPYADGEIAALRVQAPDRPGWGRGRRGVFTGPADPPRRR